MRKMPRLSASVLVLTLVSGSALRASDHPMMGEVAPAFELTSLEGQQISDSDFRGKFVVLHFGAGW